jgi:hypothetical protein
MASMGKSVKEEWWMIVVEDVMLPVVDYFATPALQLSHWPLPPKLRTNDHIAPTRNLDFTCMCVNPEKLLLMHWSS